MTHRNVLEICVDSPDARAFAPIGAALAALVSVQTGAAVAKTLFPMIGPDGVAALRLGLSAVILLAVLRPWRIWRRASMPRLVAYGLMMGLMNILIYRAFLHGRQAVASGMLFGALLGVPLGLSQAGSQLFEP